MQDWFLFSICSTKIGRIFFQHVSEMLQRNIFRFVYNLFVGWIDGLLDDFFVLILTAVCILWEIKRKISEKLISFQWIQLKVQ